MARNDIEYKAVLGMKTASVANSNLDGTGTLVTVVQSTGNLTINKVVIKASANTTEGMVRLFVEEPGKVIKLLEEVTISARHVCGGTVPTISHVVNFPKGFVLKKNWKLLASTENAEPFNVFAECLDWEFPASETKVQQEAMTKMADISTANPNLDGTGTLAYVAEGAKDGTRVNSLSIKAQGDTANGMIRLFIKDDVGNIKLQREFRVPESKQTKVVPAYGRKIIFEGGLHLPNDYMLLISTECADHFDLITEGYTWEYKPV